MPGGIRRRSQARQTRSLHPMRNTRCRLLGQQKGGLYNSKAHSSKAAYRCAFVQILSCRHRKPSADMRVRKKAFSCLPPQHTRIPYSIQQCPARCLWYRKQPYRSAAAIKKHTPCWYRWNKGSISVFRCSLTKILLFSNLYSDERRHYRYALYEQ